jgi:hypothetical protein
MTDIEICQYAIYIAPDAITGRRPGLRQGRQVREGTRSKAMTIEILHLSAQIQRWINQRIARNLAEQAERLAR